MTEYAKTHKSWILSLFLAALLAAGVWVLLGATSDRDDDLDTSQLSAFCGPGHAKDDHHLAHHHRRHHKRDFHRKRPNARGHHLGHHHRNHHRNCPPAPGPDQPLPVAPVPPPVSPTPTVTVTVSPSPTATASPTPTPTPSCTTIPGGYNQPPQTICTTPSP